MLETNKKTGKTAAALTWILREEIEISRARLPDLGIDDARREVDDVAAVADLLREIGGAEREMAAIADDVAAMQAAVAQREQAERKILNRGAVNAQAFADYRRVVGKVVLLTEVECYDENSVSVTAVCDPPAIGRIVPYPSQDAVADGVLRWLDDAHCDPVYDVEILRPHPAFTGLRPSWVYGICRDIAGNIEPAPVVLADDAMQAAYRDAKGLADDAVAPAAPSAPAAPTP